jgi:hypothetical protein
LFIGNRCAFLSIGKQNGLIGKFRVNFTPTDDRLITIAACDDNESADSIIPHIGIQIGLRGTDDLPQRNARERCGHGILAAEIGNIQRLRGEVILQVFCGQGVHAARTAASTERAHAPRPDLERVGSHGCDFFLHLLLRTGTQADHRDNRADANDDA